MELKKEEIKQKFLHEMQLYFCYALFLSLFFISLTIYRRLILGEYRIDYLHYGSGVIQALILAKVVLIGESFRVGDKFTEKPLVIPTLYKTAAFCILVFIFTLIEHFAVGFFEGKDVAFVYEELMNKGIDVVLGKVFVTFFVLFFFFAFLELGKKLGRNRLYHLFIKGD